MARKRKDRPGSSVKSSAAIIKLAVRNQNLVALNSRKLKRLYATMLRCRMIAEKVRRMTGRHAFGDEHLGPRGQEAVYAGVTLDLRPEDCVAASGQDFIFEWIRGVPLHSIFARLQVKNGRRRGNPVAEHDRHAPANIIASGATGAAQLSIATGVALASTRQKKPRVVAAFAVADPACSEFPHEKLEYAGRHKLPIIFVIQNTVIQNTGIRDTFILQNSGGGRAQPRRNSNAGNRHLKYSMPAILVDGNDAIAVCRVAQEAIRRAREGHGPAVIHCVNHGHGADSLVLMESHLRQKSLWSDAWKEHTAGAFNRKLDEAVVTAKQSRR
jgi:TPP-dependent pyruvate/acetoin dehydrogenase alpha subunit